MWAITWFLYQSCVGYFHVNTRVSLIWKRTPPKKSYIHIKITIILNGSTVTENILLQILNFIDLPSYIYTWCTAIFLFRSFSYKFNTIYQKTIRYNVINFKEWTSIANFIASFRWLLLAQLMRAHAQSFWLHMFCSHADIAHINGSRKRKVLIKILWILSKGYFDKQKITSCLNKMQRPQGGLNTCRSCARLRSILNKKGRHNDTIYLFLLLLPL